MTVDHDRAPMWVVDDRPLRELVAAEVRAWMGRQRITGEALAGALGTSGTFVSRRLRGRTSFSMDELDTVADILGVPLEQLLAPALAERDRRAMAGRVTTKGSCSTTAGQRRACRGAGWPRVTRDGSAGRIAV